MRRMMAASDGDIRAGKVSKTTDISDANEDNAIGIVFLRSEVKGAIDALAAVVNEIKAKMNA